DAPIADTQAQRSIAFQPLDLVMLRKGIECERRECALDSPSHHRIQRVEFSRRLGRIDNRAPVAHAGFLNCTTLFNISSALSKKRRTPRAAWRMRCSFSTKARRTY